MSILIGWAVIIGVTGLDAWAFTVAGGDKEGNNGNAIFLSLVVFALALFAALSLFGDKF
jgi:hypothetical protein